MKNEIILGNRVKDIYTGFEGIAIGRTDWLYGCSRIAIEPTELKDGKPIDVVWFDEQRVQIVQEEKAWISDNSSAISGGPKQDPKRGKDAIR